MATRDCVTEDQIQRNLNLVSSLLSFYATAPSSYRAPGSNIPREKSPRSCGPGSHDALPTPPMTPTKNVVGIMHHSIRTAPTQTMFLVKHYGNPAS